MAEFFETGSSWPFPCEIDEQGEVYVPLISFDKEGFPPLKGDVRRGKKVGLQLGALLSTTLVNPNPIFNFIEVGTTEYTPRLDDLREQWEDGRIDTEVLKECIRYIYFSSTGPDDIGQ